MKSKQKKTILIGIAGPSGSGKSLLANTIVKELGSKQVAVISEDAYYKPLSQLPLEMRAKINFDHPDAFDHARLIRDLRRLQKGQSIQVPVYDHQLHTRKKETHLLKKHKIIVLEGILLFVDPILRDMMDIRIFMDAPLDISFIRRLKRDIHERARTLDSVIVQYEKTVRPMYFQFIEPSKHHADISVPRGGQNRIAIDMIQAKMRELLNKR